MSDSPGLVDFAIGRVNSVFNLPGGANDVFWGNNLNNRRTVKSLLLVKKILRLVEMMSGLVNASFSFPKWQMYPETFLKKLSSQKTGNGLSEHQDFKIFYEKKPSDPRSGSPSWQTCDSLNWWLRNIQILHTQKVGQSVLRCAVKIQLLIHSCSRRPTIS